MIINNGKKTLRLNFNAVFKFETRSTKSQTGSNDQNQMIKTVYTLEMNM